MNLLNSISLNFGYFSVRLDIAQPVPAKRHASSHEAALLLDCIIDENVEPYKRLRFMTNIWVEHLASPERLSIVILELAWTYQVHHSDKLSLRSPRFMPPNRWNRISNPIQNFEFSSLTTSDDNGFHWIRQWASWVSSIGLNFRKDSLLRNAFVFRGGSLNKFGSYH